MMAQLAHPGHGDLGVGEHVMAQGGENEEGDGKQKGQALEVLSHQSPVNDQEV